MIVFGPIWGLTFIDVFLFYFREKGQLQLPVSQSDDRTRPIFIAKLDFASKCASK